MDKPNLSSCLHVAELVELAYSVARDQFREKPFSFQAIGSLVGKKASAFGKEKVEDGIGHFYTALSTDPRFVVFAFDSGKMKEFMTVAELKKLENTIFSDSSVFEEEHEAFLKSTKEKREVEFLPDASSDAPVEVDSEEASDDSESEKEDIFEEEE